MKKGKGKKEYIPFAQLREKLLRDPETKKAYDDLELKYAFIHKILDARIKAGITQSELAERAGTTQSAIARFESGAGNPTLSFIQKVSKALDVKVVIS